MTPEQVKKYFKTCYNFNKITKMSASTLLNWQRLGYVPEYAQLKVQQITNGALKIDDKYKGGKKSFNQLNCTFTEEQLKFIYFNVQQWFCVWNGIHQEINYFSNADVKMLQKALFPDTAI